MAVYSYTLNENTKSFDFLQYVQESENKMNKLFEAVSIINEEFYTSAKNYDEYDPEENNYREIDADDEKENDSKNNIVKESLIKKIINKIKELWNKFAEAISNIFKKIGQFFINVYMKFNITDSIMSKFKNIVTFPNLEKAKELGWKGLDIHKHPCIGHILSMSDNKYISEICTLEFGEYEYNKILAAYNNYLDECKYTEDEIKEKMKEVIGEFSYRNSMEKFPSAKEIEKILICDNIEKAKEIYDDQNNKLDNLNSDMSYYSNDDANDGFLNRGRVFDNGDSGAVYDVIKPYDKEGKYYYPTKNMFTNTKIMAESGLKTAKEFKFNASDKYTNVFKNQKIEAKKNLKNVDKADQINTMYWQLMFRYNALLTKLMFRSIKVIFKDLKMQHYVAIITYMQFVKAIKQYTLKSQNA